MVNKNKPISFISQNSDVSDHYLINNTNDNFRHAKPNISDSLIGNTIENNFSRSRKTFGNNYRGTVNLENNYNVIFNNNNYYNN